MCTEETENNLEKKDRFATGLKFLRSSGSSEGLKQNKTNILTTARLNTVGNVHESNDSFTTWVSAGTISSEQSNKNDVGIGSRSQDPWGTP